MFFSSRFGSGIGAGRPGVVGRRAASDLTGRVASGVLGESLSDDKKAGAMVDRFLADLAGTSKGKAGK